MVTTNEEYKPGDVFYMKFVMVGLEYTVQAITVMYGMNALLLKISIKQQVAKH